MARECQDRQKALEFARARLGPACEQALGAPEAQAELDAAVRSGLSIEDATLAVVHGRAGKEADVANEFLAHFLEDHSQVKGVVYPGLPSHPQYELAQRQMRDFEGNFAPGTIIYFVLQGEGDDVKQRGARLMDFLADNALTITLAVSLGQIRTLIEHPASMTHAALPAQAQVKAGIEFGGIRLSIGLEHPDDIIADLSAGLDAL